MNQRKYVIFLLAILFIAFCGLVVWWSYSHVHTDGHGDHSQAVSHENAITQILSRIGTFYGAKPMVHPFDHESPDQVLPVPPSQGPEGQSPKRAPAQGSL